MTVEEMLNVSVWVSVYGSVEDSVMRSVEDSVWDSVYGSVEGSVMRSVGDSVWDSVHVQILEYHYDC